MSDDDLRARLRESTASYDPAALVAAGHALLRAGRRDEAFATLWPLRRSAEGLRALASLPSWSHEHGDAGHARAIDARVPRTLPRVRWSLPIPQPLRGFAGTTLAGPSAIVVAAERGTLLVDPDDGSIVKELPETALQWDEELLVVVARGTARWLRVTADATEVVRELRGLGSQRVVAHRGLVALIGEQAVRVVGPDLDPRWTWKEKRKTSLGELLFAPGLVLVQVLATARRPGEYRAFEAETGRERFVVGSGLMRADTTGLVRLDSDRKHGERHAATDLEGRELWGFSRPDWLTQPSQVLVEAIDVESVITGGGLVLDRRTGAVRAELDVSFARWLLARDTAVCWSDVQARSGSKAEALRPPFLAAFSTSGDALWAFDRDFLGERVHSVVSIAGRLYVRTPTRLFCMEA